jgi:heterotetrameric sarcosine oxidase alpha subunit
MRGQPFRNPTGGAIDRSRAIKFRFDGRAYEGYAGDTLASALLANGVSIIARSFKYHRPRGVFAAGTEEPNALVRVGEGARAEPNLKATQVELYDGLVAESQNCWPSREVDVGAVAAMFAPLLPAGFYYKTFKWPPPFWRHVYEPLIRRAAGMGRASLEPDPDRYEHCEAHCDVLVVGAGVAGLMGALEAGKEGVRVIIADERPAMGGMALCRREKIDGMPAAAWLQQTLERLGALPEVRLLTRTTAFGYYDHNQVALLERVAEHRMPRAGEPRQRLWHVRARQVVLATGAHERSMIFANNDRPGVMLANGAQEYVNRYAVRPGRTAVVFTNNDSAYEVAIDLVAGGVPVAALVDIREAVSPTLRNGLAEAGIRHWTAAEVTSALGGRRVKAVRVAQLNSPSEACTIPCDLVCVSGGWEPRVQLHAQARGRPIYEPGLAAFIPGKSVQAERSAGAARGLYALEDCLADGVSVGAFAVATVQGRATCSGKREVIGLASHQEVALWTGNKVPRRNGKRFVDLQADVTDRDVRLAVREGYRSVEHVKRYTTLGMGTDQGKTSGTLGYALIAESRGGTIAEGGTTTFRPPYVPITLGALAGSHGGRHFLAKRRTPVHEWHLGAGAVMVQSGSWLRPQCYPQPGESYEEAALRESRAVRDRVGIVDVSTLGKFELFGRHAAEFLERIYVNRWASLPVGRSRYGLMLREDGMVFDDGTTSRLGEHHYFMTTTTAQAGLVQRRIEHCRQVLWPELDVHVVNVTEQWAAFALAGPQSRRILAEVIDGLDATNTVLPHMGCTTGRFGAAVVKILRISFSGDLAYEIYAPAGRGEALWQAFIEAGRRVGITPYGVDAMNALRIEKGHVTGVELNGRTTPDDLGLGRMVKRDRDFIGRRSLSRPGLIDPKRWQLVGVAPNDQKTLLPPGAKFVSNPDWPAPNPCLGELTSTTFSPMLGMPIGLALLSAGRARHRERLFAVSPLMGQHVEIEIRRPVFFDPEGGRLHA